MKLSGTMLTCLAMPAVEPAPPYLGSWDCGVGIFAFTEETYSPGGVVMPITRIEAEAGGHTLRFEGGYAIHVAVEGEELRWFSHDSGDAFTCTRVAEPE